MATLQKASKKELSGFSLERETFKRDVKENPADKIQIEIGDSKQDDFKPQTKIMRWDNEVNFSLRAQEDASATVEIVTEDGREKVKYKTADCEVHQYEKPEAGEDGGFEFEWILPKRPESNVLTGTIQTKGLNFWYQPEIEDKKVERYAKKRNISLEEARRIMRPENVVGSYAAYHKSKRHNFVGGKEYKTGKAFHIYRPEAIDVDGKRAWCDLNIDEEAGLLTVTVPQEFLDNAAYPVVVDPTFGYTSIGGSESYFSDDSLAADKYTAPQSGTASKLTLYLRKYYDGDAFKGVLVNTSLDLLSNGVGAEASAPSSFAWVDSAFSPEPSIAGSTDYYLGAVVNGEPDFKWDASPSLMCLIDENDYDNPEDPTFADIEPGGPTSCYVTYEAAVSASLEQEGFAFGDDDGSESAHTLDTQDTNITEDNGTKTLRTLIDATEDPASTAYKLKYQKNGSGGYVDVPVGAGAGSGAVLVETFDVDVSTNGSTHTLTNDVGDTDNAFVRLPNGTRKGGGGPTGSTANEGPDNNVAVQLTDTDELTFYKGNSAEQKIIGEVWRYAGPDGGEHEFKVLGRYAISLSGTSASQAVSGISTEDNCVPFIDGVVSTDTSNSNHRGTTVAAHMDGSGNVVVSRNNSILTATVYVTVVEFTGSAWSVGHGVSSSHDSSTETVTLNTDSDGVSGSTFDVSDWETAFIEAGMEGDSTEAGLADTLALVYPATATTQVYFSVTDADAAARNDGSGWIHVVQNDDLIVKRAVNTNVAEGNGSYGTAPTWPTGASTSRDADQLALEWFVSTSGTGSAHLRGNLTARISDPTGTISHWVHRSGNTVRVQYGVIDLSQLTYSDTNEVYISTSSNVASGGEATTARITAPSGKTTGDFTTGRRWDDENGDDSIDIAEDEYTEIEWVITIYGADTDDYFEFRVYNGDSSLDTYTLTPKWTIGSGGVSGTNLQINIGDTFHEVEAVYLNIGDAWKEVSSVQLNVGDTWKDVM